MGSTQSVLDTMTAGIMGTKAAKATTLTPVGTEKGGPLAGLPNDVPGVLMSNEAIASAVVDLRRHAATLTAVADGLDVILGVPEAITRNTTRDEATAVKLAEKEADRKAAERGQAETEAFAEKFAAQQEVAKASVFKAVDAPVAAEAAGWSCPEHGVDAVTTLTSRKGRTYRACKTCKEFQRS